MRTATKASRLLEALQKELDEFLEHTELRDQSDDLFDDGITHLALEASSHGLQQCRLDGVALAAGGTSLFLVLAAHSFAFSLAWSLAVAFRLVSPARSSSSPFASTSPPPQQVVPPEDVE